MAFSGILSSDVPSKRFLYILYISIDTNFKLKGKEHNLKDIELMQGLGAYVPKTEFKNHIAKHTDDPEEPEVCGFAFLHSMVFLNDFTD